MNRRRVTRAAGLYAATAVVAAGVMVLTVTVLAPIVGIALAEVIGAVLAGATGAVSGGMWRP